MGAKVESAHEAGPKARVFISYSRQDIAFVDRLDAALKARGFEPLIDRSEIYAFEDWWKRIEALISRADTVVFILSPDAVASDIALKEVVHAAALNKRFAPIVCRRVEDGMVPEPLRRLNFIFFDDPEHFDASADRLAEALQTDIDWIRQHTIYGEAARQWAANGRPGGLLLRSPVLEEAEHWIAARSPGVPEPTAETQTYIAESRRGATRRRNFLTGTLGAGLLIALGLAGLAYWQREAAIEQRKVASQQRETALTTQSRLLAVQAARSTSESDMQTAILLSLEAFRSPGDVGPERYSGEAEKTLLDALYRNPLRSTLRAGASQFVSAAFASDASTLAAVRADNSVSFWALDPDARVTKQADGPFPFGSVKAVLANPARPVFVFRGSDDSYFAWNFQTGQKLATVAGTCGYKDAQFTFDSAGSRLFVYCEDVSIFNLDTGQAAHAAGKFDHFALSPDGGHFVVSVGQTVTVMDGDTAAIVAMWQQPDAKIGPSIGSLAIGYNGGSILVQNYDGVQFRDVNTGAELRPPLKTGQARTFGFNVSPAANVLVTGGDDGTMVWNVDRSAPIQQLPASFYGFLLNGFLVTGAGQKITLWAYPREGHTGTRYAVDRGDFFLPAGHRFIAATGDATKIVTLTDNGDLDIWSTDPAMMLHGVADEGQRLGTPAVFGKNGNILVTTGQSGIMTAWDPATLTEARHVQLEEPPVMLDASGDGRRLVLVYKTAAFDILDVASLRSIKPAGLPSKVYAAALSNDGETLALGYQKNISFWRVTDGSNLHNCDAADDVGGLVWTDTGTLAYTMDGGTVAVLTPDNCESTQIFSFKIAPPDKPPADADIRSQQGLILANLMNQVQVWSESESKSIFDASRAQWPVFDKSFGESTLFDILPNRRVIVGKEPDSDLHIYDLATKDQILAFAGDLNECCAPVAMVTLPAGDRMMTLWSERGAFRLKTWRLLPTVADASAYAKSIVPECLPPQSRHDLGLEAEPPRWCIEMQKPPYNTPQWHDWLVKRDSGNVPTR
jgi:WD40 repeat protein